ncbi:WD40 repeat domain-containing protein [Actinoplanes subtropicus]|uniref:nSTAND1 domain-containing NTPase n=1 Tax=Actinoplanes subtropicus TaxID=543632 RepID=UPI00055677C1|nr:WD40 repeat domain-containing protein [Actinoplanes subtropicus]
MTESPQAGNRPDPDRLRNRAEFGAALSTLRKAAGLSVRDLVGLLKTYDIGKSTLGDWFKGTLPSSLLRAAFEQMLKEFGLGETDIRRWWTARCRIKVNADENRPSDIQPYRGLFSFGTADADWYFGRAAVVKELLDRVETLHDQRGGLLVVVGASGSGKSSLLLAGVVPALRGGDRSGSADWPILITTPTDDSPAEVERFLDNARMRPAAPVVIFDQFEQTFTGSADQEELVAALAAAARNSAVVVLSLRADFYGHALRHDALRAALGPSQVTIEPMTAGELREVITEPAAKAGIEIEPGLVELLIREIAPGRGTTVHEAGVLPLLSHALHETWTKGQTALTTANYLQVGRIEGAVAASAETIYVGLDAARQRVAQRLLLRLVQLNPEAPETRRRVKLQDLLFDTDTELEEVLSAFISQRLVTVDVDTVEITHEALIGAWPRLRKWIDADRGALLLGQQLDAAAVAWDDAGRDNARLYRGTLLAAARDWADLHSGEVSSVSHDFLDAGRRHERGRQRILYQAVAALAALFVLAVTLGFVAYHQRNDARTERDLALSRETAVRADRLRDRDVSLARQLSLVAYRISPTDEARASLLDASAMRPATRIRGSAGILYATAVHPNGTIVAAGADTAVKLWDIRNQGHPTLLAQMPAGAAGKVYAVAFGPSGDLLVASTADATVLLWDTHVAATPKPLPALTGLGGTVYSVVFSPDGRLMGTACADGTIRLWRVAPGGALTTFGAAIHVDGGAAKSLSIRDGNRYLAVGDARGKVSIWDIGDPARPARIASPTGPTKAIGQLTFSPDGRWLAAGSADYSAYLWNVADPRHPQPAGPPITGATSWINAVAFSPSSVFLAVASSDAAVGVRVIDIASRTVVATLPHPAPVTSVRFTPDETTVVTGANDGMARLWPFPGPTLALPYTVSSTVFDPTGRTLAVGSGDARLWNLVDPERPKQYGPPLTNQDGFASSVAFTPDNRTMASAFGKSGGLQLWNIADPAHPRTLGPALPAHPGQQIEYLTFSPDGRTLATASRDHTVRLWDVREQSAPHLAATLSGFTADVLSVVFSPSGELLAAASSDETVRIWNVADPAQPSLTGPPLKPGEHYVYSVAFSPDGRTLAVSLADSTVRLYDISHPARPRPVAAPLSGPTDYVYAVTFNDDGSLLAAAATDGTMWLWNTAHRDTPTLDAELTLPTGSLYTAAFRPGSDMLAAGGANDTVWLWHTDPAQAAALICTTSGEPMTRAEWAKYVPGRDYQPPCP